LSQAREFGEIANLTGVILTKMDGTAKGGIAVAIQSELNVPVKYIGVGETIEDLQKFNADEFVDALFDIKSESEEDDSDDNVDGQSADENSEPVETAEEIIEIADTETDTETDIEADTEEVQEEQPKKKKWFFWK
jgi:fused signal recognition particle receptor